MTVQPPPAPLRRSLAACMALGALALALPAARARAAAGAPVQADETTPAEAYRARAAELVLELKDFAEWCGSAKLFAERDVVYEIVLVFDPEDEDAHRGLKHSQRRDGSWEPPADKMASRNYSPAQLKSCERKRREIAEAFRDDVLALFRAADAVPAELFEEACAAMLRLDPNDAVLHELRGEVADPEAEGTWILAETERGRAERKAIKLATAAALRDAPAAQTIEPLEHESALGIDWQALLGAGDLRVLATSGRAEAAKAASRCAAMPLLFRAILGGETLLAPGTTIYLIASAADRDRFIAGYPGLSDEDRAFFATISGSGLPPAHYADWDEQEARRLDGAVRHALGALLQSRYGLFIDTGWAWEGLGLYLTRQLTGTRLTWYVDTSDPEAQELRSKLGYADVNWMNEALQLLLAKQAAPFAEILARSVDEMEVSDVLVAYAFSAYLLEGWPEHADRVLQGIGAGRPAPEVFGDVLGLDLASLEARFVRWLGERR